MTKARAINKSRNDTKKILELNKKGMGAAQIVKFFHGKYTYWQVYNTINKRDIISSSAEEDAEDKGITGMPPVITEEFQDVNQFIKHQISVLASQINIKKLSLERRTDLLKKLTDISLKVEKSQIEDYLKGGKAKIIINMMRRISPEISDNEILKIFNEENEKLKNAN